MLEESQYCFSLQRLGIGFVILVMGLMAIAIAYAAEVRRMHVIRVQAKQIGPISILWLLP